MSENPTTHTLGQTTTTDPQVVAAVWKALGRTDALPTELRVQIPRANRPGRECECGCGETTGGGRFRPGHDARLKSQLLGESAKGSQPATDRLVALGWYTAAELADRRAAKAKKAEKAVASAVAEAKTKEVAPRRSKAQIARDKKAAAAKAAQQPAA